ncbi:MAG TPA: AarF/UbiB family protein [Kofleriaceae bacterium]|nr:AarF/UbiB family protein [Kofleriaceae bacterium]
MTNERERLRRRVGADMKVGLARMWARAKQIVTTDPTGSADDDRIVDEAAERELAKHAGEMKAGLAKVAQLLAYTSAGAPRELASLWDGVPALPGVAIAHVIEEELGAPPQQLFERWDNEPIAAASLGQVHAARGKDGVEYAVKVQYPGIAEALAGDLASDGFARRLAGGELGRELSPEAIATLRDAILGETDYLAEARSLERFGAAWADDAVVRSPKVNDALSSKRVLTMERVRGIPLAALPHDDPSITAAVATAMVRVAWGTPLQHGFFNADPNPGNYLIERTGDGGVHVWFLDFGCTVELAPDAAEADRQLWHGILDEDAFSGAEKFRMALAKSGLLRRADTLATNAHRAWERAVATPFASAEPFRWDRVYHSELADTTRGVLAQGGMAMPPSLLLLWRARLGTSAVLSMLSPRAPFRRVLRDVVGTGRAALR